MKTLPSAFRATVDHLDQLPGIGPKAAARMVKKLILEPDAHHSLLQALEQLTLVETCPECRNFFQPSAASTGSKQIAVCDICSDISRPGTEWLVVAHSEDAQAALDAGWHARIFVLHGLVSPLDKIGPRELGLDKLMNLFVGGQVRSVTVALDASMEARATGLYVKRMKDELVALNTTPVSLELVGWDDWLTKTLAIRETT